MYRVFRTTERALKPHHVEMGAGRETAKGPPPTVGGLRALACHLLFAAGLLALGAALSCSNGGPSPTPETAPTPVLGAIPTAQPTATASPQPSPTPAATPMPATPTPTPAGSPTQIPSPAGTLRLAVPEGPEHFDVHQESSPALITWGPGMIYNRLLRFQSEDPSPPPGSEIECELCESWELVDATTYRVRLRDDVRWHDIAPVNGRELVASDVVFSYERQRTPGWPNASILRTLDSMNALGDHTLEFALTRPDAEFLERLADGHSKIVAPEAVAVSGDLINGPNIGTGPWLWRETTGSTSRFDANPDYFEPGRPGVESLRISYLSPGTRFSALLTKTIDVTQLDHADLQRALERKPELQSLAVAQPGAGAELAINTTSGPFQSLQLRRALFAELDPFETASRIWGNDAFVSVGLPVRSPSWLVSRKELKRYFEPAAEAPLDEPALRAENPVAVTVGLFGDRYVEHAQAVVGALGRLGLEAEVEKVTTRVFGDEVWFGGQFDLFLGAQPPVASASDYLFSVYHSRGAWNTTGYATDELDSLIERQAVELEPGVRRLLLREIQRRIMEGAHRFAPAARVAQWAFWPNVGQFHPNTTRGEYSWLARARVDRRPSR